MIPALVYLLCAVTSVCCALLLLRAFVRSKTRLLFWSGACFVGFTVANILLFVDFVLVPDLDISLWRNLCILASLTLLLYGLVFDSP